MNEANADWPQFNFGTDSYPDRSTTVIVQVKSFSEGSTVQVSGPGLQAPVVLQVESASSDFWKRVQDSHSQFPIGLDVILASPQHMVALPRSSRINALESA
jgi:alpha-D-ribose 1-methylphosphonate 5-triphosphate synthase subunit PhnH